MPPQAELLNPNFVQNEFLCKVSFNRSHANIPYLGKITYQI